MSWPYVVALAAGSYGLKVFGVFALGGVVERRLQPLTVLLPAALFAALIAVMTFESDGDLVLDARVAGVAVGIVAVWRKAPFIVVVLVGMAATAFIRAM